MKNFYKSFMAIRLRTVSTFYNSKTWFPSENRVRFNGRSQSYYAIGSRCNLGRVIVVRPIRNYTTVELIARVLLLNYFGNDRDTLYTDYISWKRLIEHGNFETIYNFLK